MSNHRETMLCLSAHYTLAILLCLVPAWILTFALGVLVTVTQGFGHAARMAVCDVHTVAFEVWLAGASLISIAHNGFGHAIARHGCVSPKAWPLWFGSFVVNMCAAWYLAKSLAGLTIAAVFVGDLILILPLGVGYAIIVALLGMFECLRICAKPLHKHRRLLS